MILLDRTVKVYRLADLGGNKSSYQTFTTSLEATTQPLGDEKSALYGGDFGKMYVVFFDVDINVNEADQIRDQEGNIYQVVAGGKENRNDGFMADYMRVVCKKIN